MLILFIGEPCVEIDIERDFEDEGIPDYENLCYVITSPADQVRIIMYYEFDRLMCEYEHYSIITATS